ncbi:MAG: hypothetical protein WDW36_004312 [Sanguina aurantia]
MSFDAPARSVLDTTSTSTTSDNGSRNGSGDPLSRPRHPSLLGLAGASAQGERDTMEDDYSMSYDSALEQVFLGCFDGHGGAKASRWLALNLQAQLGGAMDSGDLTQRFLSADQLLISHLQTLGSPEDEKSGSTGTVVMIEQGRLVVANVGDSDVVLSRGGKAMPIGSQHRVYGKGPLVQKEITRVKGVGGWVDDGRVCGVLAVSRAFGDAEFKGPGLPSLLLTGIERGYWNDEFAAKQRFSGDPVVAIPDVQEVELEAADEFVIIATDGLWDVLSPGDAVKWARKEFKAQSTPEQVADFLTAMALKRYTTDNVAVVVVDLAGPAYWDPRSPANKPAAKSMFGGFFSSKK